MTIVRAALLAAAGALVCALLRGQRPEFRMVVATATGLIVLLWAMEGISTGMDVARGVAEQAGLQGETVSTLLRATGIALVAEFGAQLCRDADESALAGRVELAGRAALLGLSAPLLASLTERLSALLP